MGITGKKDAASGSAIPGVKKGSWKAELPARGPDDHRVFLTAEYAGSRIRWVYDSCISREVGPMGHWEHDPYVLTEEHGENEFSSREELMERLIAFVPKRDARHFPEAGFHAIDVQHALPEEKLRRLLKGFFR